MGSKRLSLILFLAVFVAGFTPYYQLSFDPARLNNLTPQQMRSLLAGGLPPDYSFTDGSNLIMQTAARSSAAVVDVLLERGVNVNSQDRLGNTPLFYAALYNPDPEVITALYNRGIIIDRPNFDGATALFYAAADNPNPEVTARLLQYGADPHQTDQQFLNPMIMAVTTALTPQQRDNAAVVRYLLAYGANPASIFNGISALEYAKDNPNLNNTAAPSLIEQALAANRL